MAFEFFALPEEQCEWLKNQWTSMPEADDIWCWVRVLGTGSYLLDDPAGLKEINLESQKLVDLYIGHRRFSEPVWEETANGKEVVFAKSQAIQFDPSLVIDKQILLKGQLGIAPRLYYEEYNIDFRPISHWYQQMRRSLGKIMTDEWAVGVRGKNREFKKDRFVHITPGAVSWRKKGGILKQDIENPWDYDTEPRSPRER